MNARNGHGKTCPNCGSAAWRRTLCARCQAEHDQKKASLNRNANHKKRRLISERGNICQQCGAEKPLIAHHIVPLASGGSNDDDNISLVCKTCHDRIHQKRERVDWASL